MDEDATARAEDAPLAFRSAANIRRYLDAQSSGSPHATSVVLQVRTGGASGEGAASGSDGIPDAAVRGAVERLRRRVPKTS